MDFSGTVRCFGWGFFADSAPREVDLYPRVLDLEVHHAVHPMRAVDGSVQLLINREWEVECDAAVEVEANTRSST